MTKASESRKARLYERKGNTIIMDRVDPHAFDGNCAFCNKYTELRPFGPNNENICFECGMKDPETTSRKCAEMMEGSGQ